MESLNIYNVLFLVALDVYLFYSSYASTKKLLEGLGDIEEYLATNPHWKIWTRIIFLIINSCIALWLLHGILIWFYNHLVLL